MSWFTIITIGVVNLVTTKLICVLPLLWAGMIIGISLIATPIKFQAVLLDLPTALDVGRVTFAFFNLIEWILLICLLVLSWINKTGLVLMTVLSVCLIIQTFWILPVLNDRVMSIIQGTQVQPTFHHTVYGCIEIFKCLVLLKFQGIAVKRNLLKKNYR